jgi:hypothetical protein
VHLLLEEIRQKEPLIERAVVASEEMMALLLGLLAREPTQRLRVEDLRRNQLFTRCAEMPPSSAMAQRQLARDEAKEELRSALPLAMVALRPQAMPMEPLRADANEDAPTRSPTETGGELTEHRTRNTAVREAGKDKQVLTGPREASRVPGQLHDQPGSAEYLNVLEC